MSNEDYLTTREVAALLRIKERKVYELAADGRIPVSRITGKLLFPRVMVERWLQADVSDRWIGSAQGISKPLPVVMAGSHDPLLEWAMRASGCGIATYFDGSRDGLVRLGAGDALAAGTHLPGDPADNFNVDALRAAAPGAPVVLLEWARRRQGLVVRRDDERRFRRLGALAGHPVVRRQPGAGSRALLDRLLADAGVDDADIDWQDDGARSETDVAMLVATGKADAGLAIEAAARQAGLGFIALAEERFDLAVWRTAFFETPFQTLWRFGATEAFRNHATALGGYDLDGFGTVHFNGP